MNGFSDQLQLGLRLANQELEVAARVIQETSDRANRLARQLEQTTRLTSANLSAQRAALARVRGCFVSTVDSAIAELRRDLEQKREGRDSFTVGLFGRTEAGKSTLREALTGGDGSTIGAGAGRTTRDVRRYEWNRLQILDTPGFAAYQGDVDARLAITQVGRCDLLIFLVSSDGLQPDVFQFLASILRRDKRLLIALNVKKDLAKRVYLQRFLKRPETVFEPSALADHRRQIQEWCDRYLDRRHVPLVAIHARAAYQARQLEWREHRYDLWRMSGIVRLRQAIVREVRERGAALRIRTVLGDTAQGLALVRQAAIQAREEPALMVATLEEKHRQLEPWLTGFLKTKDSEIAAEIEGFFAPLTGSLSQFVDDHLERSDFGDCLRWHGQKYRIPRKVAELQERIQQEALAQLQEFGGQVEQQNKLLRAMRLRYGNPSGFNPFDYRRTFERASAYTGVIGTLYPPARPAAAPVSLVLVLTSRCFSDRDDQVRHRKTQVSQELRTQVASQQARLIEQTRQWFDQTIRHGWVRSCLDDVGAFTLGLREMIQALDGFAGDLHVRERRLQRRLIKALLRVGTYSTERRRSRTGRKTPSVVPAGAGTRRAPRSRACRTGLYGAVREPRHCGRPLR